ncbi:cadherin domain-containing protein, partial [Candidatus Laterigemmans baculatus]|uniref:cadherin domain-containing protein n=2 Tax=Candidatus Laterigemmans baculatus TaxID=2770505 RepID=UPI00193B769A
VGITASSDDADGTDSVSYSLDDDAGGRFAIDANTGVVTLAAGLDYETSTSHSVTVRATSTDGSSTTQSFTINVNDVDEFDATPVVDTNAAANEIDEDAVIGSAVGITASSDDADGTDSVSYSLDDDAGGRFAIDANTGVVTLAAGLDYETSTSHTVTVRATSTDGSSTTQNFTINVNDIDEFDATPVVDANVAANEIDEDAVIGSAVGITASSDDADGTDSVSYSLDDDAGGRFAIDANTGVVTLAAGLDYETSTSHSVTIRATSTDGSSTTQNFTINVNDVDEFDATPVVDANAAANEIDEDAVIGSAVGITASSDDADGTDSVSYSLDDDAGGRFAIDANTGVVTLAAGLDYEANTSHSVTVRATSTDGSSTTQNFTINVNDVDEFDATPVIDTNAAANEIDEDAVIGSAVGITASSDDADGTDSVSYSLDDDAGGRFAIDANTGVVTLAAGLDYETSTSHSVTVRATSTDGSSTTQNFTINVNDVDEFNATPVIDANAAANEIDEDAVIGSAVGITASSDDADGTDSVSYSLDDDAGGRFAIDANTGVVTLAAGLDYETSTSHSVTVRATSTDGSSTTQNFTINVNDIDEFDATPVVDANAAANEIDEDAVIGSTVGITASSDDADGTDSVSYSLDDDAGGRFAIDANTGVVTLAAGLDYETSTSHSVTVRATSTDGSSSTRSVLIQVRDQNDNAPVVTPGQILQIDEAAANGQAVGSVLGTDADTVGTLQNWTIASGDPDGIFAIDQATGLITIDNNANLDYESRSQYELEIHVSDGVQQSATAIVTVQIQNVNEAPVLHTNQLTIGEGGAVVLSAAELWASDVDTPSGTLQFQITSLSGGHFERIAAPGLPITEFSQSEVSSGSIRFVHHGGESAPSYKVTVSDGSLTVGDTPVVVDFLNHNDAPTVIVSTAPVVYIENAAAQPVWESVSIDDPDSSLLTSATIRLVGYAGGEDQLNFTGTEGISGSWDSATGVLTLTGAASAAEYQSVLESVVFLNTSETPSTAARSLVLSVSDSIEDSALSITSLEVVSVNDVPVAASDSYTTRSNESIVLDTSRVVANDVDIDGDALFPVITTGPRNGSITVDSQGRWVYTPAPGFFGVDVIEYQASDGQDSSEAVKIQIEVTAVGGSGNSGSSPTPVESGNPSPTNGTEKPSSSGDSAADRENESDAPAHPAAAPPRLQQNAATQWMAPTNGAEDASGDGGREERENGDASENPSATPASRDESERETRAAEPGSGYTRLDARVMQEVLRTEVQQSIAWGRWDAEHSGGSEASGMEEFAVGSVDATAAFVSIGYVMWTLRGGLFVTSMFGSLPAWRMIDPTSLLLAYRNRQADAGDAIENLVK